MSISPLYLTCLRVEEALVSWSQNRIADRRRKSVVHHLGMVHGVVNHLIDIELLFRRAYLIKLCMSLGMRRGKERTAILVGLDRGLEGPETARGFDNLVFIHPD